MRAGLYSTANARSSENVRPQGRLDGAAFPRTPEHSFRRIREGRQRMHRESRRQKISLRPPLGLYPNAIGGFVQRRVGYGLARPLSGFRNWTDSVTKLHNKGTAKPSQAVEPGALLVAIEAFLSKCRNPATIE